MWHGASWNFVVWGMLHAIFQVAEEIISKASNIKRNTYETLSAKIRGTIITFIFVDFAWIFFMSKSLRNALGLIRQMFTVFQTTDFFELGLDSGNWFILNGGLITLMIVDVLHEKKMSIYECVAKQEIWFRWILYFTLLWITILFGIYGPEYDTSTFIYFQF